jgi:predicted MFS family arabinose efflux permease
MAVIYAPQPLLGEIAQEFGRSAFEANFAVSATTLGIAVGVFPTAWLSARLGRRRVISTALVLGAILTLVTALATDWWLLVGARVLTGIVISAVLVSALVWASEAVPRAHSRRVAALYVAGTTGGGMLGRLVAGLVADATDWRIGIIAVDVLVVGCAVAGIWLVSVYDRGGRPRGDDLPAAGAPERPEPARAWLVRARLCVLGFLGTALFVGTYNAMVFRMLEPPFSLGVGLTSLLFLTYLAGTWSSVQTGGLVDRLGLRPTLLIGIVLTAVGVLVTGIESVVAVIAGLLVLSAGFFVVHTAASSAMPSLSRAPTRSSAWYTLLYYAGSSVGALAFGLAWDNLAWPGVLGLACGIAVVAAVIAATIPRGVGDPAPVEHPSPPVTSHLSSIPDRSDNSHA